MRPFSIITAAASCIQKGNVYMFCKKCGTQFPDNSQFCPACGEKASAPAAPVNPPVQQAPYQQPQYQQAPYQQPQYQQPVYKAPKVPVDPTSAAGFFTSPLFLAFAGCVSLVALLTLIRVFFMGYVVSILYYVFNFLGFGFVAAGLWLAFVNANGNKDLSMPLTLIKFGALAEFGLNAFYALMSLIASFVVMGRSGIDQDDWADALVEGKSDAFNVFSASFSNGIKTIVLMLCFVALFVVAAKALFIGGNAYKLTDKFSKSYANGGISFGDTAIFMASAAGFAILNFIKFIMVIVLNANETVADSRDAISDLTAKQIRQIEEAGRTIPGFFNFLDYVIPLVACAAFVVLFLLLKKENKKSYHR